MRYLVEHDGVPSMAEDDALGLWRRACEEDADDDRVRLAENFQPMIAAEAGRLAAQFRRLSDSVSTGEFVGWGNLGLLRAFCCYRPDSPIGFYEYCRRRVGETMRYEAHAAGEAANAGIGDAAEVARLWGELSREFSSQIPGAAKPRIPDRQRVAYRAATAL